MKSLKSFEKHQINTENTTVGGGLNTTYSSSSTATQFQDTWYLFKSNNSSSIDEWNCPQGHTDYTLNRAY